MIWIAHKAKEGDTLSAIVKQYKNKDQNAILKYYKNKKVAGRLGKGEALKKGELVWVLNPKSKAYVVSNGKCNVLLDECGYRNTVKEVDRVIDKVLEHQRINFHAACDRHNAQIEINNDQVLVYTMVSAFSRAENPRAFYNKAAAAYKNLHKVVSGRKYKDFQKAAIACDIAVSNYNNAVIEWVHGLIDGTARKITQAKYLRAAGEFSLFAIILVSCPPASLGASVALGAGASVTTGLAYDGYDAIGREIVGEKQMSHKEIGKRMLVNGLTGAAGSLIVGGVLKLARPHITNAMMKPIVLKSMATRVAAKHVPKAVITAEMRIAAKLMEKRGSQHGLEYYMKTIEPERLLPLALQRTIIQTGTSGMTRLLTTMSDLKALLLGWMSGSPKELQGKDSDKVGRAAATYLMDAGAGDALMAKCLKVNKDTFRGILRELILDEMVKAEKAAA